MVFSSFFSLSLFWFLVCCSCANGAGKVQYTITVDPTAGQGNFTSVQAAINSVPDGNKDWIRIKLNKGIFREKIMIGITKEHILLEGAGSQDTMIVYDDHFMVSPSSTIPFHPEDTLSSSTFTVYGAHFVARGIEFRVGIHIYNPSTALVNHNAIMQSPFRISMDNSYNVGTQNPRLRAVAATVGADMASFYNCTFTGSQDTLCDYIGRHYFWNCWIEGSVDFIFGYGQSIYEQCTINSIPANNYGAPGYITAQGRSNSTEPGGFVFKHSHVTGTGATLLGRAWGPAATVIFYKTRLESIVDPIGWGSWNQNKTDHIIFEEVECTGPGNKTDHRAWFANKHRSPEDMNGYLSITFIDKEGWLLQQPE